MDEHSNKPGDDIVRLTRRDALKGAIALVGGAASATTLAPVAHALMADDDYSPAFLSKREFALLEHVVDLMIPETDTPGALGAGVHRFIDMMLAEWADERSATTVVRALREIDEQALDAHGVPFAELDDATRFLVLERIDTEAYAGIAAVSPYVTLKKLILLGYYTSEPGATVELIYDPIPGEYEGCVPLADIGRAYYKHWGISGGF